MTNQQTENWKEVKITFGKKAGTKLGEMSARDLNWWKTNWFPNPRYPSAYDNALRAALDVATADITTAEVPAVSPETAGIHIGTAGEKVTVTATVTDRFDFTTEFNRKKVVQEVAILLTANGSKIKWKTADIPSAVKVGEEITMTGTVKEHTIYKGERITVLKLVKLADIKKLIATHFVTLFCDGKSSADRIAVTNCVRVLFAGNAGIGSPTNGDNTDHELAAALKALEIANEARESAGLPALRVDLNYDAQWMGGMVGKAKPIRDFAKSHNLIVNMIKIAGLDNPADEWTVTGGERRHEINLADMVYPIMADAILRQQATA